MTPMFLRAFKDNYIWILIDETRKTLACVDPGDALPVIECLQKHDLILEAILVTHHHSDHAGGVAELVRQYPQATVFAPQDSRIDTGSHPSSLISHFSLHNGNFQVINIPGHTATHVCYHEAEQRLLFCGDTLFSAGCGRVFDGTLELLHASLLTLKALPDETQLFSGHEYTGQNLRFAAIVEPNNTVIQELAHRLSQHPGQCSLPSSIALEKQINPFFRLDQPDVIKYAQQRGCRSLDSFSVFRQLRADKDVF
jgi:hydroxyacylglutathione hydrolase